MAEEAPSTVEEAPSCSEDIPDDKETPLLPPETQGEEKTGSKLFFHLCGSRLALVVLTILSLIIYFSGFLAALASGYVSVSGQNVVAMVFNMLFALLILYGAFKHNSTVVLVALLWKVFIVIFGIVGTKSVFDQTDWSQEPAGTEKGTEAFIVISLVWEFLMIYAQVVFVCEVKDTREEMGVDSWPP